MKLKVGDKAIVKQYEDMAKKGTIVEDNIYLAGLTVSVSGLKALCGTTVTISGVDSSFNIYRVNECRWFLNDEMLDPIQYPILSNEEVWKWLGNNVGNFNTEQIFGEDVYLEELMRKFSFEDVVKYVSKYEYERKNKFVPFNIDDLKSGMVIEYGNEKRFMIMRDGDTIRAIGHKEWIQPSQENFDQYYEETSGWADRAIVKVFNKIYNLNELETTHDVIWERKGM